MTQATNSAEGEIVLGGDLLSNDGNAPTLRPTGVTAGTYSPVQKMHVDSKGRITWVGATAWTDLEPVVPSATTVDEGLVRVGSNIDVSAGSISINDATTNNAGVVSIGSGLAVTNGVVTPIIPDASPSVKGLMQVGSGLSVTSGVVSQSSWNDATVGTKGMVQVGSGFNVSSGTISVPNTTVGTPGVVNNLYAGWVDMMLAFGTMSPDVGKLKPPFATSTLFGILGGLSGSYLAIDGTGNLTCDLSSAPIASAGTLGLVRSGAGLAVDGNGILSLASLVDATTSIKGAVQIGTNIDVSAGTISVATGSAAVKGLLQVGTNIDVSSGTISVATGTDLVKGLLQVGSGLSVSAGTVSYSSPNATTSTKGVLQVGSGLSVSSGVVNCDSVNDNATTSSKGIVQVGTNINVASGVISVPKIAINVLGLVKQGENVYIDGAGSVSILTGSKTDIGVIQAGDNITWTNRTISIPTASVGVLGIANIFDSTPTRIWRQGALSSIYLASSNTAHPGVIQPGSGFTMTGDILSSEATHLEKGVVQVGTSYMTFSANTMDLQLAGASTYGVIKSADVRDIQINAGVIDIGTQIPLTTTANTFTKAQVVTPVADAYTASYTPDLSLSNIFTMTLTGNLTINNPTNVVAGGVYTFILTQDGTGGRTLTLGSNFKTAGTVTLSTTANKIDTLTIIAKSATELYVIFTAGY